MKPSEERREQERMRDILLLIGHLFEREEATAKLVLGCLYDIGYVNLINNKFRFCYLKGTFKSIAKLSKGAFLVLALYWFQKKCPQLIADYLHSLVEFKEAEALPAEATEVEVASLPEAQEKGEQVKLLRRQVRVLTGMLIASIAVFGGGFIWLTYNLKLDPLQLLFRTQPTTVRPEEPKDFAGIKKSLHQVTIPQCSRACTLILNVDGGMIEKIPSVCPLTCGIRR
ncbi:MAG: hypothetical protein AB4426_10905 [Xenococcaceae cyanobacterium]